MIDDGFEIKCFYIFVDFGEDWDYFEKFGFFGEYLFICGVYVIMYCGCFWMMRQYVGFGMVEESNKCYKYFFSQGQIGLSVVFDLLIQMGYDSDYLMVEGEVGKVGVVIDFFWDMEIFFDGILFDKVLMSMIINVIVVNFLVMYIFVVEKQGVLQNVLRGIVQNDILKEYIVRGIYIFLFQLSMRFIMDIIMYCVENVLKWNLILISGYYIREVGVNVV